MDENNIDENNLEENNVSEIKMEDSILSSIKKLLGIGEEYTNFDVDIIIHINTAIMVLQQLGVGPQDELFKISSKDDKWSDFISNEDDLEGIKTYIYLKVKIIFDPPQHGPTEDAFKESIREYEWRLNHQVEMKEKGV